MLREQARSYGAPSANLHSPKENLQRAVRAQQEVEAVAQQQVHASQLAAAGQVARLEGIDEGR
ncbi:hypothetical protein D3C71_2087420 [compost metagenome]